MKKISIDFIADSKEFFEFSDRPIPCSSIKPEWLKKIFPYVNDKKSIDSFGDPTSTIKKCLPVSDAMTCGYFITLPCDVWVHNDNKGNVKLQWAWQKLEMASVQRMDQYTGYPIEFGYMKTAFKWINHWITKTPKGWSCLFIHPMHHDDLPFKILAGLVDTDKYPIPVHFPFLLKEGFSGIIKKGTPIVQVIPFKRETFTSKISYDRDSKFKNIWKKVSLEFFDRYMNNFWTKKTYEEGKISKCPFGFLHKKDK